MTAQKKTKDRSKSKEKAEYQRFLVTARETGASKDPKDFDKAIKRVVKPAPRAGS